MSLIGIPLHKPLYMWNLRFETNFVRSFIVNHRSVPWKAHIHQRPLELHGNSFISASLIHLDRAKDTGYWLSFLLLRKILLLFNNSFSGHFVWKSEASFCPQLEAITIKEELNFLLPLCWNLSCHKPVAQACPAKQETSCCCVTQSW